MDQHLRGDSASIAVIHKGEVTKEEAHWHFESLLCNRIVLMLLITMVR